LSGRKVLEENGHGAITLCPFHGKIPIYVTGPNRDLFKGTSMKFIYAAPGGNTMVTGPMGLVKAAQYRFGKASHGIGHRANPLLLQKGGEGMMKGEKMEKVYYSSINSPFLKRVFVASTLKGVCMVDFLTTKGAFLRKLSKNFPGDIVRDDRKNQKILSQLLKYLKGELRRFDYPMDMRGTPFQKKVWSALARIPYGHLRSYKDIAKAIGYPKAFRAVGNANGSNPMPLIIPCHRVIASDGGLGGYGHGVKIKRQLLALEHARGIR
jgi:methylated-DNA-[protein]-cysteine S-methyltransferase